MGLNDTQGIGWRRCNNPICSCWIAREAGAAHSFVKLSLNSSISCISLPMRNISHALPQSSALSICPLKPPTEEEQSCLSEATLLRFAVANCIQFIIDFLQSQSISSGVYVTQQIIKVLAGCRIKKCFLNVGQRITVLLYINVRKMEKAAVHPG